LQKSPSLLDWQSNQQAAFKPQKRLFKISLAKTANSVKLLIVMNKPSYIAISRKSAVSHAARGANLFTASKTGKSKVAVPAGTPLSALPAVVFVKSARR